MNTYYKKCSEMLGGETSPRDRGPVNRATVLHRPPACAQPAISQTRHLNQRGVVCIKARLGKHRPCPYMPAWHGMGSAIHARSQPDPSSTDSDCHMHMAARPPQLLLLKRCAGANATHVHTQNAALLLAPVAE